MKAFRFSLQSVLALRERAEQNAQQRCAADLAAHEQSLQSVRQAENDLQSSWEMLKSTCTRGAPAADIARLNAWSAVAQDEARKRHAQAEVARVSLERSRLHLRHATQERQALDNLKQRRRTAHQQEFLRQEQKQLDETAGRRRDPQTLAFQTPG